VGDGRGDGGEDGGGTPLFNPSAGIRALADVQRRGLIAAGELVDRLIGAVDGDLSPSVPGRATRPTPDDDPQTLDFVNIWIEVFQRGLQAMIPATRSYGTAATNGAQIATADLARGTTTGAVHIQADADSGSPDNGGGGSTRGVRRRGSAEVWLHNGTPEPLLGLRLHAGDLRAHNGTTLPESALRFDPPSLDELPGRSSRGVVVTAEVADGIPGGVFRGVLLVTGVPDVWLPIVVTVAEWE
jgi:hypothetical protein